jgi:hypothetical protein
MIANGDSSPFQSSPFNTSDGNSSPRLFWKGRDSAIASQFNSENAFAGGKDSSPSPTRRSSIERLQRASRVKNSNMFARQQKQEYDPTTVPVIERPLARPLNGNAYGGSGIEGLRSAERSRQFGHQRNESKTSLPLLTPTKTQHNKNATGSFSPSKDQASPAKSSMASKSFNPRSSFDPDNGTWSEETSADERELPPGRSLHRHAKSVTFDAAPPQVNEYEMATPDMSSVGSGSRENSYDSREDEEEDSYVLGEPAEHDDSFDASLEDTDKTPVVGPDDWRHASPDAYNKRMMPGSFEDSFDGPEGSPMPEARPASNLRSPATRTDSLNSNGEHRPLPPLPGMTSDSPSGLSAAAERVANSPRHLPSPPAPASISKSDLQEMSGAKMTLEERLRLMMIQDDENTKTPAEIQRERRMRRAGSRDRNSQTPERDQSINIHEDEDTLDDLPGLDTFQLPPRISRESILRKVNGQGAFSRDSDYNFSSPPPRSSPKRPALPDPDTPIPSTEKPSTLEANNADGGVVIKPEPEDDDEVDVYAIPDMYQSTEQTTGAYYNEQSAMDGETPAEDDADSQYSDPTPSNLTPQLQLGSVTKEDSLSTLRGNEPKEITDDAAKNDRKASLPELSGVLSNDDFGLSLQAYMTPSPPVSTDAKKFPEKRMSMADAQEYLRRPITPEQRQLRSSKPEYDGTGWGPEEDEDDEVETGTPDSVIRHPVSPSPPVELPVVPERIATIKSSSGSKLKTRPSATPSDIMAMRELRRQVSGETPAIPPIPARHINRPSVGAEQEEAGEGDGGEVLERQPSLKKKSLTLDIGSGLGLGLDKDFDRVIEAQKVAFDLFPSHSAFSNFDNGQASILNNAPQHEFHANITPRKQRGYLMRQNTKVVVASSDVDKGSRSAGNSPVKKERPQSWTVEPWNGSPRKGSVRSASGSRKKPPAGPVPPMPGQESNVSGLGMVTEEAALAPEEGAEKGRLFVKVMGVKDLDLPLPKSKTLCFVYQGKS